MSEIVFDTSAYLAVVHDEPGADAAIRMLPDAAMSTVNFSEVVAKLAGRGASHDEIRTTLEKTPAEIVPFNEPQAIDAGMLRPVTRTRGLSFGDRACLALARALGQPVLTADWSWAGLDVGVEIRLIR